MTTPLPRALVRWGLPVLVLAAWGAAIGQTGRWPGGDGPHLLGASMRLAQLFRAGELGELVRSVFTLVGPHPPGAYLPGTLAYTVLGSTVAHAHLVAGAGVLLVVWDAIRRLGGGVVGALVLAATPLVWLQAEAHGADLLAAACVAQALSWLVVSDRLESRRSAAFWGAWMGAAFLAKYTAPLFLWAPCLLAGVWVVQHRRWGQLGRAVAAFTAVAGLWYALRFSAIRGYLAASTGGDGAVLTNKAVLVGPWWSWERLSWYPATLVDAWGWLGAGALLVCVASGARRRGADWPSLSVPLAGIAGGLLLLCMQGQRQDRYLLPALPLAAALVGSSRVRWGVAPVFAVGAYGAAATFVVDRPAPGARAYEHNWRDAGEDWPWVDEAYRPVSLDPAPWLLDEGIAALRRVHGSDDGTVGFLLDERDGAPTSGLVFSRVAAAGLRWNVATAAVMDRRGGSPPEAAVFVGPFATETWPSRSFTTLLAIVDPTDHRREAWLRHTQMRQAEAWTLPHGREGRIYVWEGDGRIPGTPLPLPPLGSRVSP